MGAHPEAAVKRPFRVGVTHDFQTQAGGVIEPAIREVLPDVEWEYMPDTGPVVHCFGDRGGNTSEPDLADPARTELIDLFVRIVE